MLFRSKVLVDVKNGNNIMYLPLDKMLNNQGSTEQRSQPATLSTPRTQLDSSNTEVRQNTARGSEPRTGRG